ncbi:unnamed protein product [Calypogeia fissa]
MGEAGNLGQLSKKRPHVLCIPHATQGHIVSAVLLSKQLVRHGIRVTVFSHQREIDRLLGDGDSELKTMDLLQFVGVPRPDEVARTPREASTLLENEFKAANMVDRLSGSEGPTCLLADFFIHWSADVAQQLQIPRYTFIPSGAVLTRLFQAVEDLYNEGTLRVNAGESTLEMFDGKISIPGLPPLQYLDLPRFCRQTPITFKANAKNTVAASGLLINTFYELEASVIDTLRNMSPITGQKFYTVGPIFRALNLVAVEEYEDSKEECIRWLDAQPDSSVLYICFGTMFQLDPVQIREVALGLERSKHRFLWVLPNSKQATLDLVAGSDMLPPGFEARVAERGYILKGWAPQVQILAHPSTGGFLTHCGWNSVLEAVNMGVSLLAWPLSADQYMNCRYLVDDLKVASEVQRAPFAIAQQEEVERAVRHFMEVERLATRSKMDFLKLKAATALADGGSSTLQLQQFVQDVKSM